MLGNSRGVNILNLCRSGGGRYRIFVRLIATGLPTISSPILLAGQIEAPIHTIRFEPSAVEPHLPQSSVYAIHQDRRGFLWFGTREGFSRWDGYQMRTWKATPFRSDGLPGNLVRAVIEDRDGNLWVRSQPTDRLPFRVARLVAPEHERVESFPFESAFPFLGRDSAAWLAARDSLRRFDGRGLVAVHARVTATDVQTAFMDRGGTIWLTSTTGALERYPSDGLPALWEILPVPSHVDPGIGAINAFFQDDRGTIWATGIGVRRLDMGARRTIAVTTPSPRLDILPTTAILQDDEGWLWIGTLDGIFRMDPAVTTVEHYPLHAADQAGPPDFVMGLVIDRGGALWAGTPWGLFRYDPAADLFGFLGHDADEPDLLSGGMVMALAEDGDDALWVGTLGNGLNRVDRRTGRIERYRHQEGRSTGLPHDWTWNVVPAGEGRAWIGTGAGVALVDRRAGGAVFTLTLPTPEPPWSPQVTALFSDGAGGLWIGAGGYLWRYSAEGALQRYDLPAMAEIQQISADDEQLWIATSVGLVQFTPGTGAMRAFRHNPADPRSLSNDVVLALHHDRLGRLWVGTGSGLSRYEPDAGFVHFLSLDSLPSSVIYAILEDDDERLWLSTNRGLVRFDPTAPAGTSTRLFTGSAVGNVEFNRNAALRGSDGTLYFGGDRGITYFHPPALADNPYRPPIVITALHRAGRGGTTIARYVDDTAPIRIAPDVYTVTFELAALSYTDPGRNQYRYRLEGFQPEWVPAGHNRLISYTNLPPGQYLLRVQAANEDGIWNEAGLTARIIVEPWLWETRWFRTGALLALLTLVSGATAFVLRSRHRLQLEAARRHYLLEQERARISRDMHDEVGANLTEIALLSERARHPTAPDGAPASLDRIAARSRETLATIGEIIWAINPDHDQLDRLAAYLREYASAFLESAAVSARLDVSVPPPGIPVTAEFRRNLFLVLKEALANAAAHASAREITVGLATTDNHVQLVVRDDGLGFSPSPTDDARARGHDGLVNMHQRAAELGGALTIESVPGQGTVVTLDAPLPKPR